MSSYPALCPPSSSPPAAPVRALTQGTSSPLTGAHDWAGAAGGVGPSAGPRGALSQQSTGVNGRGVNNLETSFLRDVKYLNGL